MKSFCWEFVLSDKIIWLAAYPKTGSTWVRTIMHQLLAPDSRAKDAIPSFDREYPADAPTHPLMGTEAKVLRTHCHPDHKVFRAMQEERTEDQVVGVVTIKRHPLDVLLSQLNYSLLLDRAKFFKDGLPKKVEDIIAAGEIGYYIDAFVQANGCPEHVKRCQSYPGFYAKWRTMAPKAPHLQLRYEDMVSDPIGGVDSLIKFFRLPEVDTPKIVEDVEKLTQKNGKFFWRKRAYNYRALLPKSAIERFENAYSDRLESLGYGE
jgi:hypothetical protein